MLFRTYLSPEKFYLGVSSHDQGRTLFPHFMQQKGRVYVTVIDALLSPEVRDPLRSPFDPESDDNKKVHYMLPTVDVELSDFRPSNITWVTADLILERHCSSGPMKTCTSCSVLDFLSIFVPCFAVYSDFDKLCVVLCIKILVFNSTQYRATA